MRREDWPDGLNTILAKHAALPFAWGVSDCLLFPIECVKAMTDRDLFDLCGEYRSQLSAYRRLKDLGFANVGDAFGAHFEEIAPSFMGRGDLATVVDGEVVSGAVCIGAQIVGKGEQGLTILDRSLANRAFKVD